MESPNMGKLLSDKSDNWLNRFPRLNELYVISQHSNPDDIHAGYVELGKLYPYVQKDAELLEEKLAQLDPTAWEDLKSKLLSHSSSKQKSEKRKQFWELLNEVRGYVLLAGRGYSKIKFIPSAHKISEKRADLLAESPTRAILEVKTINRSDDDRERDRKRIDPTFSVRDIIDLSSFVLKLHQKSDPVSAFLWEQVDRPTQELLANYASNTMQVKDNLVENLNRIIHGRCIFEKERFRDVHLQPKTEYLLDAQEECFQLCLNRCLLDDKYTQELSNWSKAVDGVEVYPTPDMPAKIPDKLLKKLMEKIEEARSQIETTIKTMPPVDKKIVLLIINRDFGCGFIKAQQFEAALQPPDLEVVCQIGDF
jgi:hypothetical protein